MSGDDLKPRAGAKHHEALGIYEVSGRVSALTQQLLKDGADASDVAFALTTVAADMGFQVTGNPWQVVRVLMDAIALQAKRRLEANDKNYSGGAEPGTPHLATKGKTVH